MSRILTDIHSVCTAGKRMKFATKHLRQYPPHFRYVTTLPREKKVNFWQICSRYERKCIHILIFCVFKIWSFSAYQLQIKFSMSLFFYLFTIVINLWHQKCRMRFVANFVCFQHCKHFENPLRFDKVTESLKVGTF